MLQKSFKSDAGFCVRKQCSESTWGLIHVLLSDEAVRPVQPAGFSQGSGRRV